MAIVARTSQELSQAEITAAQKFVLDHPELTEDVTHNLNELADYVAGTWKMILNEETLRVAFKNLSEAGRLRLKSAAKLRWEAASKGVPQQTVDALTQSMRRCYLVTEGDEGFENKTNLLGYLQGREVSAATVQRGTEYLMGTGVRVHWAPRPSQNPPQDRGHKATSPSDFRFAPREDTNVGLARHSHSANPRFNGQEEAEKREAERKRFNKPDEDLMAGHKYVWKLEIDKAIAEGRTHTERQRIAQVAQQTPGGVRLQAEAAQKEAALIRKDRERMR